MKSSTKEDRRKMENCKADNITEKLFRSYWKQGKLSLYKKHLYRGLYINSCSLDVSAIKNALLKHLQIYSKILTVGAVQVFSLEIHLQFHFLGFFFQEQLFSGTHENVFYSFFFYCNVSYSLCFYLFLQKIRRPVLFSLS